MKSTNGRSKIDSAAFFMLHPQSSMPLHSHLRESGRSPKPNFVRRRGRVVLLVAAGLTTCLLITLFVFGGVRQQQTKDAAVEVLVHDVQRGDFVSIVTEAGDVESASNVEVVCQVKAEGTAGTTILQVVDEGTVVKQGDFLLQFDDSALQLALTQQEIQVATDQALVIQAESELDKFVHMLNEYKDGLYVMDKETYESALLQAESHLSSVRDSLAHTKRMFAKGYVSRMQLAAEEKSVAMAEKAAQAAQTTLMVHNKFTRQRFISEYEADIEKQKALLKAAEYTLQLSEQRRDELKEQIAFCRVVAPADGQVVYRNDYRRRPPLSLRKELPFGRGKCCFDCPTQPTCRSTSTSMIPRSVS